MLPQNPSSQKSSHRACSQNGYARIKNRRALRDLGSHLRSSYQAACQLVSWFRHRQTDRQILFVKHGNSVNTYKYVTIQTSSDFSKKNILYTIKIRRKASLLRKNARVYMALEYSESKLPSRIEIKFPAIIENTTKLGGHKRFIRNLNF